MNRRNNNSEISGPAAWARRAADVAALLLLGLGLSVGVFAQSPTGTSPSGTSPSTDPPRPYSWPNFHAGGATAPGFRTPLTPTPGQPAVPYGQLQGTPTGLYTIPNTATAGTFSLPAGTQVTTQIPSRLLGNYNPNVPPGGFVTPGNPSSGVAYFPNHFRDGGTPSFLQIVGPFGYTYPTTITQTYPQVEGSPAAVNVTEYPDLTAASYYGVVANPVNNPSGTTQSPSAPDTVRFGANSTDPLHQIRQVVYFGRTESVPVINTANGPEAGGVAVPATPNIPAGTNVQVGAVYAMDGFTGGIIWRYQVPSFSATSQVSSQMPFTAVLSNGTLNNAQTAAAPQPFQIGPTVGSVGVAGNTGLTPGTLTVASTNLGGLPSAGLQYTLYASSATPVNNTNQVLYSGTYAIYPAPAGGATPVPASQGFFTLTATFGTTTNLTGTFTATSGAIQYSPATFNGTLNAAGNSLGGTLFQTYQSAQAFGSPQVYSSPVVTRCEIAPAGGGTPSLKTVVIVADNNGFVYCLNAVGNNDGSSNSNIYPAGQNPALQQTGIAYDEATATAENLPLDPSGVHAHVGTTSAYWVYRPDPNQPKYVSNPPTGTTIGSVKPKSAFDPNSDLPVPGPFGMASANVYVNPATSVGTVYIGNSNGVLYALDATGVSSAAATATAAAPNSDPYNNPLTGLPGVPDTTNTPKPLWWFSSGGPGPDGNPVNSITSAPAVHLDPANGFAPVVYVGTSSSIGSNTGRLYAVDGLLGPRGNNGESDNTIVDPTSTTFGGPGSLDYNVNPRPYWAFPDQYGNDYVATHTPPAGYQSWSTNGGLRPSVGDITGSPVVFNNPHDGSTRIYFAANAGSEVRTEGTATTTFPANQDSTFGRIWGINTNGSASIPTGTTGTDNGTPTWVYPNANNPNNAANDGATEPSQPMGGFLNATPAMGVVEFPATILEGTDATWTHTDEAGGRTLTFDGSTTANRQVSMLYVGTDTPNDAAFYEVDVDGTTDAERNIYRLVSPSGAGFQSSPALVTNSSATGKDGNGGAVYISAANTLFQFQATPISNPTPGQAYPFIAANGDTEISGAGPISSPAIAAADVTNLPGNTGAGQDTIRDWVYIADDTLSLCRGFTPNQSSFGTTENYLPFPPVPSQVASTNLSGQFPLRAFIFNGTTEAGNDANMNDASPVPGTLPVFDWGQSAYIRIANVVPPAGVVDPTNNPDFPYLNGTSGPRQALVIDPADPTKAYGDGGPVTFQLEDATTSAIGATLQIPAVAPTSPTPNTIDPKQNGFYRRTDTGTPPETTAPGSTVALNDTGTATGHGWVGAYTYHIGFADGSLLANTPGAQRRLINVSQRVTLYTLQGGVFQQAASPNTSVDTMPTGDFVPNGGTGAALQSVPIDQPTFGILNPLAVRGGGLPLGSLGGAAPQPLGGYTGGGPVVDGIGPFRAVNPLLTTPVDLEALANGNLVYTTTAPTSGAGISTTNPTQGTVTLNAQASTLPQAVLNVATSTPQILDGSQGDNTDTAGLGATPPVGNYGTGVNGIANPSQFGPAMLDIADRSLLSQVSQPLQVSIEPTKAQWNDNAVVGGGGATNGLGSGAASVINHLPWEDMPVAYNFGTNASVDYPDIQAQNITNDFTNGTSVSSADLTPTSEPNNVGIPPLGAQDRQVNTEAVRVQVNVPKYQPANLQLYQVTPAQTQSPTSPLVPATNSDLRANPPADSYFPMGYVATEKVYASTNGARNPSDPNVAYREVQVYTGVPVDIKTSITNPTTDLGVEPAGFGTQMSAFSPSGTAIGAFTPYNAYAGFAGHFQPLNIVSDSNVNLLDPHLDQKIAANGQAPGLPLLSDATESGLAAPYSYIPGYDFAAASDFVNQQGTSNTYTLNGVNTNAPLVTTPTTILPQPFLIRSSLDSDVGEAFGRNPVLAGQDPLNAGAAKYPTVTFHKPRVGDGTGSPMTIPDVPHDDYGAYYLPNRPGSTPSLTGTVPAYSTQPYVGIAIPFGTPVGAYAQNLRLFEGYDTNYNPLIGPTYDGAPGGSAAFDPNTLDTFQLNYSNGTPHAVQPYSDPATQLRVAVGEDRLTDGFTAGALPMIDFGPSVLHTGLASTNSANFAPFALAEPYPGTLGLYWASSRDYVPGAAAAANTEYQLDGAKLNVRSQNGLPTYYANDAQQWWSPLGTGTTTDPFSLPGQPTGNNIAFSVAQTQAAFASPGTGYGLSGSGSALYGFGTNVTASGPLSLTTLYCSPMSLLSTTNNSGTPAGTPITITSSPQPKSDQHGLAFTGVSFADPNGGAAIGDNLWSFWTGGTRGRTGLYYSSTTAQGLNVGAFAAPGVLPVPAGLVAVNDPNPVLTNAPDIASTTGTGVPAIEVTYSGTGASGSPDLYLSRYRPYHATTATGANGPVQLGLMPFPALQEQLQPDTANLNTNSWWQARDVGWVRNDNLSFSVSVTVHPTSTTSTTDTCTFTETTPGTFTGTYYVNGAATGTPFSGQIAYDRASGILAFTNVTLPLANGTAITPTLGQTVFVDVSQGRIRFSLHIPYGSPNIATGAYSAVLVNVNATARRITTSPAADTEPVAFLDEAYQPNSSGVLTDQNVQADRYWFVWHKTGGGGTNPTLWYKTQRLTVALTDGTGQPITIDPTTLTVKLTASGQTLYAPGAATNAVDVDTTRGRLYFPITFTSGNTNATTSSTAMEGQQVTVTAAGRRANGSTVNIQNQYFVEWADEPLYNDTSNQTTVGVQEAASDGYQVPMVTSINESGVSAFLDPGAFQNTASNIPNSVQPANFGTPSYVTAAVYPHKVWLFWTSNRNGTADLYSEAINPRFTAANTSGSP